MAGKARKGILNYTTRFTPLRTAIDISALLVAKGAHSISIEYPNGEPVALAFVFEAFAFRLPCNVEGYEKAMNRNAQIPQRFKTKEQAKRTAWRNLKEWVEVQLAFIEANQAEITEIFLPYIITDNGQTLFQRFTEDSRGLLAGSNQRLLGDGQP